MGIRLGMKAELSFKTTAPGTYKAMTNVVNLTQNLETDTDDATTRANNGWKAEVATLSMAKLEWEMVWDPTDEGIVAVREAYLNKTPLFLRCLDRPDGEGLQATYNITNFTQNQPIDGVQKCNVTASIYYDPANPPGWVNASSLSSDSSSPSSGT